MRAETDSSWSSPLSVTITGPAAVNNPPATPSVPSGSTSGSSGTSYSYSTKATDPDGDQVKYTFDWGDGTTSATSLVSSGTSASASHTWTVASGSTKTFSVRAKATDENGDGLKLVKSIIGYHNRSGAREQSSGNTICSLRFNIGFLRDILQLLHQGN